MKTTQYFEITRKRPDRAEIQDHWTELAVHTPDQQAVQANGRVPRWASIPEAQGRYLRVVLLKDSETAHNAFFDRRFTP